MEIRAAIMDDLEACYVVGNVPELDYFQTHSKSESLVYLQDYLDNGLLLVAFDKTVLGFLTAEIVLGKTLWIDGLVVAMQKRSQGIGTKLLQAAQIYAAKKGLTEIYLTAPLANKLTQKFYESQGFKRGIELVSFSKIVGFDKRLSAEELLE